MKIKSRTAVGLQINPIFLIRLDVRFRSKADMCTATGDVRYPPKADIVLRKRHAALPPVENRGSR